LDTKSCHSRYKQRKDPVTDLSSVYHQEEIRLTRLWYST